MNWGASIMAAPFSTPVRRRRGRDSDPRRSDTMVDETLFDAPNDMLRKFLKKM